MEHRVGVRSARGAGAAQGVHERKRGRRRCGEEARRGRALRTHKNVRSTHSILPWVPYGFLQPTPALFTHAVH